MAYTVLLLFLITQTMLLLTAARTNDLVDSTDVKIREISTQQLAIGVANYFRETATYPASIAALVTTPGFEYLKTTARPFQSYAVATNLNDGVWTYNRAAVFSQDPYATAVPDATYLAINNCGVGAFSVATTWCGDLTTPWSKAESRDAIAANLATERKRLRRLLDKFTDWYNGDTSIQTVVHSGVWGNNYPNPGAASAVLTTLVAGYVQTATTCTGIYTWHGIPIDCADFYSIWGTPTVYNYVSATHISLLTLTPYTTAAGAALYVSTDESL